MQHTTHMPISKEGVLKNDEYDPYAVIVLNQLWCSTNSLLNNPKKKSEKWSEKPKNKRANENECRTNWEKNGMKIRGWEAKQHEKDFALLAKNKINN